MQQKKKVNSSKSRLAKTDYDDVEQKLTIQSSPDWLSSSASRWVKWVAAALFLLFLLSCFNNSYSPHVCVTSRKLNNGNDILDCPGSPEKLVVPINTTTTSTQKLQTQEITTQPLTLSASNSTDIDSVSTSTSNTVETPTDTATATATPATDDGLVSKIEEKTGEVGEKTDETTSEDVEERLKVLRTYRNENLKINYSNRDDACKGRGIYVYNLPSKFNRDMTTNCKTVNWVPFCEFLANNAFGDAVPELGERWFNTHQFSLEPMFHDRILKHPCRVYDPQEAKLFFVPFYAGLDEMRYRFNKNITNTIRDELILELMTWLNNQKSWKTHSGHDHVFVAGKITWDFRRFSEDQQWGNRFFDLDEMQNPMKLLLERNPWEVNEAGVPYPSFFHPKSDNDISTWQNKVTHLQRPHLVSFAGAPRPADPNSIRSILINQCNTSSSCEFFDCRDGLRCHNPIPVTNLFMESEFCLQPPGDSATRKSFFDAMVAGCIPVVFTRHTAYYQYAWHLPRDWSKYSVFVDLEEVRSGRANVVERVKRITPAQRDEMRRYIVNELLPGFLYADPDGKLERFEDAFTVTIHALLEKVKHLP